MPAFNFKKQFAPDVESGKKHQTIRSKRKNRPQVGQTAYLYTGMRTKACRKLGEAEITAVQNVNITFSGVTIDSGPELYMPDNVNQFARDDGFKNWHFILAWFDKTHGLPFEGDLIKW